MGQGELRNLRSRPGGQRRPTHSPAGFPGPTCTTEQVYSSFNLHPSGLWLESHYHFLSWGSQTSATERKRAGVEGQATTDGSGKSPRQLLPRPPEKKEINFKGSYWPGMELGTSTLIPPQLPPGPESISDSHWVGSSLAPCHISLHSLCTHFTDEERDAQKGTTIPRRWRGQEEDRTVLPDFSVQ